MRQFNLVTIYYDEKWKEQVTIIQTSAEYWFQAVAKAKKDLASKDCVYKKSIEVENIEKLALQSHWWDAKILRFTELLKIWLQRKDNLSVNSAILFVYKQMVDPLIYLIYARLENKWEKFSAIIKDYPNVFNEFYVNIVRWYYEKWWNLDKWLDEIIDFYKKRIEFKQKVISSSMMSIIAIVFSVWAAFLLDTVSYPNLKEQYMWYPLPITLEIIHIIVQFVYSSAFIAIFLFLIWKQTIKVIEAPKLKLYLWQLALKMPFLWKIKKIQIEYTFIMMYVAMHNAWLTQSQILSITASTMENPYVKWLIQALIQDVQEWWEIWKLLDNKYRFFWEDIVIAFKSPNMWEQLEKLKINYWKISEAELWKAVQSMSTLLLLFSLVFGLTVVVSFLVWTMGVNDIISKEAKMGM